MAVEARYIGVRGAATILGFVAMLGSAPLASQATVDGGKTQAAQGAPGPNEPRVVPQTTLSPALAPPQATPLPADSQAPGLTGPKESQAEFPYADLLIQAFGAFIGAGAAFGFALWLAKHQRMSDRTAAMVDEFSSREMLQSRFATVNVETQIQQRTLTLREVALSMVRDCPVGFTGPVTEGLTEHQHVSLVVGWMRRLAVHLEQGWVDRRVIAATLGGSLQWTLPLLLELANEAERIIEDFPSARAPELRASWIFAVRKLDAELKKAKPHHRVPGGRSRSGRLPVRQRAVTPTPSQDPSSATTP